MTMAKPPSAITGIAKGLPKIMKIVSRKERVYTENSVKNLYRFCARRSGLGVQDLSLVDTAPLLAPWILEARAGNQTVREAFPVPTWVAPRVCPWVASLPASEQGFDGAVNSSKPEAPDDAWDISDDAPWPPDCDQST
jgi:hypothetical protein